MRSDSPLLIRRENEPLGRTRDSPIALSIFQPYSMSLADNFRQAYSEVEKVQKSKYSRPGIPVYRIPTPFSDGCCSGWFGVQPLLACSVGQQKKAQHHSTDRSEDRQYDSDNTEGLILG